MTERMRIQKSKVAGLTINLTDDCPDMNADYRTPEGYMPPTCLPCWNRNLNEKFHPEHIPKCPEDFRVDSNISELIEQLDRKNIPEPFPQRECQFYDVGEHNIQLSAKTEFFHPYVRDVSFRVLSVLAEHYPLIARRCRILTKQVLSATEWKEIPRTMMVGASITTMSTVESRLVQPFASTPRELVQMLRNMAKRDYMTWVVVEPFYRGMDLPRLVNIMPFLREVWVGRLNYGRDLPIRNPDSLSEAMQSLKELEAQGLIKFDVRQAGLTRKGDAKTVGDFAKSDADICEQFIEAWTWARDHAPNMRIRPKREILKLLLQPEYADRVKLELIP